MDRNGGDRRNKEKRKEKNRKEQRERERTPHCRFAVRLRRRSGQVVEAIQVELLEVKLHLNSESFVCLWVKLRERDRERGVGKKRLK